MQETIRSQMNRYPVFSCQPDTYIDQSQLFKDEEIKNSTKKNLSLFARNQKKAQTIVSIYDRIASNNANDPLYTHARKQKQQFYSTTATARNSNCEIDKCKGNLKKSSRVNVITKFMGQLAQSMHKQGNKNTDVHRNQKISLLRRIIEHYNIKSVERKYYSNLIKNFGLKIESVNTNDIAIKKSLHPRQQIIRNATIENSQGSITQQTTPNFRNDPKLQFKSTEAKSIDISAGITSTPFKNSVVKRIKPSNTFILSKQYSFNNSRENVRSKKSQNIRGSGGDNTIKARWQISQKMRRSIQYSQKLIQKPLRMQGPSSTSIQDKLNKYRDFLFLINISNGLYRNLDIQKYQKPFKFFVGKGNNKNLIKSLMKKRFWFQETNDPNEANFIWTQIKLQQIFKKQQSGIKIYQGIQSQTISDAQRQVQKKEAEVNLNRDLISSMTENEKNMQKQYDQIKKQLKKHQNNFNINLNFNVLNLNMKQKTRTIKFNKCKTRAKDYAPRDPLLKIVIPEDAGIYRQIAQSLFYKKYPTFLDKVKLCSKNLQFYFHQETFMRVHNHFPLNGLLGNKKALYYNLKQYCKLSGKNLSEFIPQTYHIKNGLADEEYKSISVTFQGRKKQKLPNYWIMKPGQFSNRGQGITCTNKLQQIRQRVSKCKQMTRSEKQSSLIVQLYITNPLLYNGRKFDIRVYMMVTINNGKIKGYWYQEGYVRTSSFMWSLNQMGDKFIHLTNDAIQKNCQQYGLYEPGNKLTFNDLQRYLHTLPKSGKNIQFFQAIYPQMRSIATDAIKCACLNLDQKRLKDNFQIFGLDFMIDQNVKPWLIEVNTNPCLQLNCPILERIIPHMVQNAFRVALDPLFPPPSSINSEYKYSIPQNALHYNKFQLVFDEGRDGQCLRKLYKNSNIMQKLDDIQQDQQIYQCEGDMLDIKDEQ